MSVGELRCRACEGPVQKNYDHVGDCATGNCSGTFVHVRPLARPCAASARDIGHGAVISAPVVTSVESAECERLKKLILDLFPAAQRVEVVTRDRLEWHVLVRGPAQHVIRDWIGRCDSELAALTAAGRWFSGARASTQRAP